MIIIMLKYKVQDHYIIIIITMLRKITTNQKNIVSFMSIESCP